MRGYNKTCTPHLNVNKSNGVQFVRWLLAVDSCCMYLNADFISYVNESNLYDKKYNFDPLGLFLKPAPIYSVASSVHQGGFFNGATINSAISVRISVTLLFSCYGWLC